MKKSMILLGMLSIGYAHAQEGNVGINTETPKATLDIQPNTTNLAGTTNEGLLIPRLSKDRVAKMATPSVSTLVYVNEFASYTGSDTKVVDIDATGFYHYNGTKWVKHIDTNGVGTSLLWEKEAATGNVKLVDAVSGDNKIFYNTYGGHNVLPKTRATYKEFDMNGIAEDKNISDFTQNSTNIKLMYGDTMKNLNNTLNIWGQLIKTLNHNVIIVDQKDDANIANGYIANANDIRITPESNKNYHTLVGGRNSINFNGMGEVKGNLIGAYNYSQASNGSVNRLVGAYNQTDAFGKAGNINTIMSTYNYLTIGGNSTGKIGSAIGSYIEFSINSSKDIHSVIGMGNSGYIPATFKGSIDKLFGVSVNHYGVSQQASEKIGENFGVYIAGIIKGKNSNYGIKIDDVGRNGAVANFAIHTSAGKVRIGDLANATATTDRQVVVDKDGVLKVGTATATSAKAINTEDTCTADNAGTFHYKEREVNGQQVGTMGFCTKQNGTYTWVYFSNGANIIQSAGTNKFGEGL